MSRHWHIRPFIGLALLLPAPLAAQDSAGETIDILVPAEDYERPLEDCSAEQEAASISGEIIVCRRRQDSGEFGYDKKRAERQFATKTMTKGNPTAPDLFGIPNHGMVVARGCFIPPCPPPPALIIDIKALPEAPPGSDADRLARGLSPTGDGDAPQPAAPSNQGQLGLPPVPDSVSPSKSASPTAEPSS